MTFLLVLLIKIKGYHSSAIPNYEVNKNSINIMDEEVGVDEESYDWGTRPWICRTGTFPPRNVCSGNRYVDISNYINNCRMCGVNFPLNWQFCNSLCVNINLSSFNCGGC